jgi:transketolase
MNDQKKLDELCINTIRMLAVDQVEAAKSGHPGMPLGCAPMAYVLWTKVMRHNPRNPRWFNRDRFVLSAGHGSALLYAMLHLTGYELPLDELKDFRQWGSATPGHPEYGHTPGVEATTGPLGQGFGMGVGMAMAERFMNARYERNNASPVDHHTYAIVSDGDLMEGVASEAASIAGHLKLGKLVYLYDDNHISIEGDTDLAFDEDVLTRFKSYGWHTQRVDDGNDCDAIEKAIVAARDFTEAPSIIAVRTHIGFGSPKQDNASAHGEPLGGEATRATKKYFGWPEEPFRVPDEALKRLRETAICGREMEEQWKSMCSEYGQSYPEEYRRFQDEISGRLDDNWNSCIPTFPTDKAIATRSASGKIINAIAKEIPNLIGGSADLGPSNKTSIDGGGDMGADNAVGRNIHFGVREHAMGAIVNGMALHGGVIPYGGTFLIFSDYMRPSIRLAALMNTHSTFVFTHDSVGVGEDGPTHQPVEQLASLRAIPNLTVFRPADANETAEGWKLAMQSDGPFAFALSRQNLPVLDTKEYPASNGAAKGAYVIKDCDGSPDAIIIATGSEVHTALEAQKRLSFNVRVVSMPSWEIFEKQPQSYRDEVLPPKVTKRIAVEAGATFGWERWVGSDGDVIGIDRFGASAPGDTVMKELGISVERICDRTRKLVEV